MDTYTHHQVREEVRAIAAAYARLLRGRCMLEGTDDAALASGAAPGQEQDYLAGMAQRLRDWIGEARRAQGALREDIVRRVREIADRARRVSGLVAKDLQQQIRDAAPWNAIARDLDTEFGAEFGRVLGGGTVLALGILGVYLWIKMGKR